MKMHQRYHRICPLRAVFDLVFLGTALLVGPLSEGADIVWNANTTGAWNVAGNWTPSQVPTAADNVFITNNGTYGVTVPAGSTAAAGSLTIGGASGAQISDGNRAALQTVITEVATILAQAIVRDGAKILAGYDLTPNAMAAADVSAQSKTFMVDMNAATSVIITKSPYMMRAGFLQSQQAWIMAEWAAKNGSERVVTLVNDWATGIESETCFKTRFLQTGGCRIERSLLVPVVRVDGRFHIRRVHQPQADDRQKHEREHRDQHRNAAFLLPPV